MSLKALILIFVSSSLPPAPSLAGFTVTPKTSYKQITAQDMQGFHWSITDPPTGQPAPHSRAVGRDLNWILNNPEQVQKLKSEGKKILCYFNMGRLQADPWKDSKRRAAAYHGVYKHYRDIPQNETCNEIGDKWGEPWISWKPSNRARALKAYQGVINEAKKACDGLEYDNLDVTENILDASGKRTNACGTDEDIRFMLKEVCDRTHQAGMSCFLKNSFDKAEEFGELYDGVITEQCFTYSGNAEKISKGFKGKPIACIEYKDTDVEGDGAYDVARFGGDCKSARRLGITNFWVESSQAKNGIPVPGKVCENIEDSDAVPKLKNGTR